MGEVHGITLPILWSLGEIQDSDILGGAFIYMLYISPTPFKNKEYVSLLQLCTFLSRLFACVLSCFVHFGRNPTEFITFSTAVSSWRRWRGSKKAYTAAEALELHLRGVLPVRTDAGLLEPKETSKPSEIFSSCSNRRLLLSFRRIPC